MPTPEELARQNIDTLLRQCGWIIQDYKKLDLSAGQGISIREVRLDKGRCDYLLLIDRKPIGIIEAKKEGVTLSSVADQSGQYAENLPDFLRQGLTGRFPFLYESTGIETYFRDERDPHPRSRRVFAFHRPETLSGWLEQPDTLRHRLAQMPFAHPYNGDGVRVCRVEAISGLEKSFAEAQPRALIQMATGAGKTLTACAFTYSPSSSSTAAPPSSCRITSSSKAAPGKPSGARALLKQADVHTLLRLPTGIFSAQGVKANVLFFDRKPAQEKPWTSKLWIYDLRTNQHFTLKENTLKRTDLDDFVNSYNPKNRHERKETDRFKSFTYEELIKRDKINLDIFRLKDESLEDSANLPAPGVIALEITEDLEAALAQFAEIAADLKR